MRWLPIVGNIQQRGLEIVMCFVLINFGPELVAGPFSNDRCMKKRYRRYGNFRVIKFSWFKFSCENIFVVWDTHDNFLTVSILHSQVHLSGTRLCTPRKRREQIACCVRGQIVATMQLLANYSCGTENRKEL